MSTDAGNGIQLSAVPETLLWTLFNRATEARRPDTVLHDPESVRLVDMIDFPFVERFGKPHWSQAQALRARRFDDAVREFLEMNPGGTVVSLGEGLETQFWRVDNGRVRWITVDLPEVIALRQRLLPASSRVTSIATSALDHAWISSVDPSSGVLVTAQGLLMYLPEQDVRRLVAAIAEAFPGGAMVFDAIPRWLSRSTLEGRSGGESGYVAPPMVWGMDADELVTGAGIHPEGVSAVELRPGRGRGPLFGFIIPALYRIPAVHNLRLPIFPWVIVRLTFPAVTPARVPSRI